MNTRGNDGGGGNRPGIDHTTRGFGISVPQELVAQYPLPERDRSRLLVYDAGSGAIRDDLFVNAPDYLSEGDCLVYNDAKVIHARLRGRKIEGGARLELLLTRKIGECEWLSLVSPARRVREGTGIALADATRVEIVERLGEGLFRLRSDAPLDYARLRDLGEIPLPKYIKRKPDPALDGARYQTVFSSKEGAVASPTAGLHFTERLVERVRAKGVTMLPVTLYVDWGTFKPVKEPDYRLHKIHKERYEVSEESAAALNRCIGEGRRILCVGTTSVRTLETAYRDGRVAPGEGETGLYVYPGYRFKVVDGLFTNFHMPDSTLILLVAAFCGEEGVVKAYRHAVERGYRFYSYGDAMFAFRRRGEGAG